MLRDSFAIFSLENNDIPIYSKDDVIIDVKGKVYLNENDTCLGTLSNFIDDCYSLDDDMNSFRKNDILPNNTDNFLWLSPKDIFDIGISTGQVCFIKNDLVVIYCGCIDIPKELQDKVSNMAEVIYNIYSNCCEECSNECIEEREENKIMNNLFSDLGFGKLKTDKFKLSMNGIAVAQSNGKYVVYNKDNNEFVDVDNMLFDIKDALFLLPAIDVNVGDTVVHENKPYFIVDTENEIKAVSYEDCTQTVLIPKSTMFGIKYFTKVFSMFGDSFASNGDLFSNPMMLMAFMEGKSSDLTNLMLFNSLSKGDLGSNPMALAMMLKGDKGNDSLSTIAMLSMMNNGVNLFNTNPNTKKTEKGNK